MRELLKAIVIHENGINPYKDAVYDGGMRLAGIADIAPVAVMSGNGGKGITIATASTAVAATTEVVRQAQEVRTTVDGGLDVLGWIVHLGMPVAFVCIAAGIGLFVWDRWQKQKRLGM